MKQGFFCVFQLQWTQLNTKHAQKITGKLSYPRFCTYNIPVRKRRKINITQRNKEKKQHIRDEEDNEEWSELREVPLKHQKSQNWKQIKLKIKLKLAWGTSRRSEKEKPHRLHWWPDRKWIVGAHSPIYLPCSENHGFVDIRLLVA